MLLTSSDKKKKPIRSEIVRKEKVDNFDRRGNESDYYYPVYINDGKEHRFALFTESELTKALERGRKNPEDTVPRAEYWLTRFIKFIIA